MVKLVYCIRRRPEVPPDAFRKHWLEVHAPKVEQFAQALQAFLTVDLSRGVVG